MERFTIAGAAVVLLLLVNSAPAAASGWSIKPTPDPTGGSNSMLNGVSCASASHCMAVGNYDSAATTLTLAERWNGTAWSIEQTPDPTGATQSYLNGVACASAGACTAVGYYYNGTTYMTLAERWNGTGWSIEHTRNPTGSPNSELGSVACASASSCTAVGYYYHGPVYITLAERWNGTRWSIEHTPNPTGGSDSYLGAVSCPSAKACTAVGSRAHGTTAMTLAERWNGTRWSIEHTPNPTGASNSALYGLSCASVRACTAVGPASDGTGSMTLAERWNGTRWSIEHTPHPTSGSGSALNGVSCPTTSVCTAVGNYANPLSLTLAEKWNGTHWSIAQTPNVSGGSNDVLGSVSCASRRACTAVGSYSSATTGVTLAEVWTGAG